MSKKYKCRLTGHEEFELINLVFDKFLWLSIILASFGLYNFIYEQLESTTRAHKFFITDFTCLDFKRDFKKLR